MQRNQEREEMEKNRSLLVQPRGGASSDVKKYDNLPASKNTKYPKKKDGASYSKSEGYAPKKSGYYKNKGFDKRPRSRGFPGERSYNEVNDTPVAEFGSALQTGSKKGNLNHLLNFTLAPREAPTNSRGPNWKTRNNWSRGRTYYNKEQFLQANCQFVVQDRSDYALHSVDPDVLVDWDCIEQVRIFSHEVPSCPICLYPPTAAKITRCGHIYCWTCMLHYLSLDDKSWRKCPICYESVHCKDLKSVVATEAHHFKVGENITMKLMKKTKGSTVVLPKSQWHSLKDNKPLRMTAEVDTCYSKLLLVSNKDILKDILEPERAALLQQQVEEGESLEGSFVSSALVEVAKRREDLGIKDEIQCEVASLENKMKACEIESKPEVKNDEELNKLEASKVYTCAFMDEEAVVEETASPGRVRFDSGMSTESLPGVVILDSEPVQESIPEPIPMPVEFTAEQLELPAGPDRVVKAKRTSPEPSDYYYFYQADDGQHIYLHSLNARCLAMENGNLENCPEYITAKIEALEAVSMTQELRKRLKYLSHLPKACEFFVAELSLKPPILSKGTLKAFEGEIEARRRNRQKKARSERRFNQRIEAEERKKMGDYKNTRIVRSEQQLYRYPPPEVVVPINLDDDPDLSPPLSVSPEITDGSGNSPHMSFAQMLRAGNKKPEAWPKVSANPSKNGNDKKTSVSNGSDNEDYDPAPSYQHSFSDAVQAALDNIPRGPESPTSGNGPGGGGGKKKKQKMKLVFSNTMNRAK